MWELVKIELKYFREAFYIPMVFILLFQVFEFYVKYLNLFEGMNIRGFSNWTGVNTILVIIFILSIWQNRFKEKRERVNVLLPISSKSIALSRFWFLIIPFLTLLIYFLLVHFLMQNLTDVKMSFPLIQFGVVSILIAGYIRARDDWFSYWNFGKRVQAAFVSVLIIQILVVAIFLNRPEAIKQSFPVIGEYAGIIFFLLGAIIMITTIFSYQKRKSYLS